MPLKKITLYSKRRKLMLMAGMSLLICIVSYIFKQELMWWYWPTMTFFCFGFAASAISLVPGASYLQLDENGLTFCSLFRTDKTIWSEIISFGVWRSRHCKIVTFDTCSTSKIAQINRKHYGSDKILPDNYGMEPEDLIELLEKYRSADKQS